MKQHYFSVLTIAGSDSSGGAGIQADIKTISATGCYAASVITALTAQNTLGVQASYPVPCELVEKQLTSVLSDLTIHAVKIGMVHNENIISVIASQLRQSGTPHIILDPVMISKNGCVLLADNMIHFMASVLFPLTTLVTPNIFEAEKLTGKLIHTDKDQQMAAASLGRQHNINVLVKGGHADGIYSSDALYLYREKTCHWFRTERIQTDNTHGTGCTLSSAIASFLARGMDLVSAITAAKKYLTQAILSSQSYRIGHGHGPPDHFYVLRNTWNNE